MTRTKFSSGVVALILCLAMATAAFAGSPRQDTISGVQQELADLGFQVGPIDGVLGPRTRAAIRAFQRSRGRPVTGEATTALLELLRGDPPAPTPPPATTPPVALAPPAVTPPAVTPPAATQPQRQRPLAQRLQGKWVNQHRRAVDPQPAGGSHEGVMTSTIDFSDKLAKISIGLNVSDDPGLATSCHYAAAYLVESDADLRIMMGGKCLGVPTIKGAASLKDGWLEAETSDGILEFRRPRN